MKKALFICAAGLSLLTSCETKTNSSQKEANNQTQVVHPEWSRNAVIYEVNLRQYTEEGTINAFESHLPRLKELGVDILWFMPVHPISEKNRKGTLGSYYAVQDYKEINPEFGTKEDFKRMVDKAHQMGLKVLLDWVANHTGGDNVWMAENPDWFVRDEKGDFVSPYDWTDTYKLNYENPDMRAAMMDALEYWVREYDIDGYRCDVAFEVPTDFWDEVRPKLDAIKPVFMLAEAEHPELLVNAFDMCYNWPLKDVINQIAAHQLGRKTEEAAYVHESHSGSKKQAQNALDLDVLFAYQDSIFPTDSYLMNQITNHDLNSWEGTEFERLGPGVKAFAVLTYTIPGMPLIYTGQETGMDRALEFFEKDTPPDWTRNEWFTFYQKMNELKHSQAALEAGTKGGKMVRYFTESPDAYIYKRTKEGSKVLVYLNLSNKAVEVKFKGDAPSGTYKNLFTEVAEELPTTLQAWEYRILIEQ